MSVEDVMSLEDKAEAAFDRVLPDLKAIPPTQLEVRNVELRQAVSRVLQVVAFVEQNNLRDVFTKRLSDFDPVWVEGLADAALATWHVKLKLLDAEDVTRRVRMPSRLREEAVALRERMLPMLQYHLSAEVRAGLQLDGIAVGRSYADLASDLARMARMARAHVSRLVQDPAFVPEDVEAALRLSLEIVQVLDAPAQELRLWRDLATRAWTWLVTRYRHVADGATYVLRDRPDMLARFVPLSGVRRRRRADAESEVSSEAIGPPEVDADKAQDDTEGDASTGDAAVKAVAEPVTVKLNPDVLAA